MIFDRNFFEKNLNICFIMTLLYLNFFFQFFLFQFHFRKIRQIFLFLFFCVIFFIFFRMFINFFICLNDRLLNLNLNNSKKLTFEILFAQRLTNSMKSKIIKFNSKNENSFFVNFFHVSKSIFLITSRNIRCDEN